MVILTRIDVSNHPESDRHSEVVSCTDAVTGLQAIIAVHNISLGPALGGCRIYPYATPDDALTDVLRLSRGMTYKSALAGLPLGGGKAVIIADPKIPKTPEMMRSFGAAVQKLAGRYITAEDVGTTEADMIAIHQATQYVSGLPPEIAPRPLVYGNPSPTTACGVYHGIAAAAKELFGDAEDLHGLRVAIQGLGAVGFALAEKLYQAGAQLVVADVNAAAVDAAMTRFAGRVRSCHVSDIHRQDVDIFAPCALGAGLNAGTIPDIRARLIAGGANNQLAEAADDRRLMDAGIAYAPDYVINAAGVMRVAFEYFGRNLSVTMPGVLDEANLAERVRGIGSTIRLILREAKRNGMPTGAMADHLARDIFLGHNGAAKNKESAALAG
ncbi:MAG: Glu/Leu/Phe/Val dehydrogenase dimerization domain-containing protein [Pseudomonadota bacterium]